MWGGELPGVVSEQVAGDAGEKACLGEGIHSDRGCSSEGTQLDRPTHI